MVSHFMLLPEGVKKRRLKTLLKQVVLNTGVTDIRIEQTNTRVHLYYLLSNTMGELTYGMEKIKPSVCFSTDSAIRITHLELRMVTFYVSYLEVAFIKSAEELGFIQRSSIDLKRFPWYAKPWVEVKDLPHFYVLKENKQYEADFLSEGIPAIYV